ncbi:hypothetical protein CR513_03753, partial [Mucuna pruriens]
MQTPEANVENPQTRNTIGTDNPTTSQTPAVVIHIERQGGEGAQERLQYLEERLRAIEGVGKYNFKALDLCLVPDVIIPYKFNKGNLCPKNHLISYYRKMVAHTQDDKLLIHFFQEILTGPVYSWYLNLEKGQIKTWADLAETFLQQY